MICPVRAMLHPDADVQCVEKKCAWWNQHENDCAVYVIAQKLRIIANKGEK